MSRHQNIQGLKCSFEQCKIKSKKLTEIREHIRQAHSVKNPVLGTHFADEYSIKPAIDKNLFDEKEIELASIYECLDEQIDFDVLRSNNNKVITELSSIKEEGDLFMQDMDPEYTPPGNSSVGNSTKTSDDSKTISPGKKRKRINSNEKLVVKIRNKREKRSVSTAQTVATAEHSTDRRVKPEKPWRVAE